MLWCLAAGSISLPFGCYVLTTSAVMYCTLHWSTFTFAAAVSWWHKLWRSTAGFNALAFDSCCCVLMTSAVMQHCRLRLPALCDAAKCWRHQLWCNTAGLNCLPCVMLLSVDDISCDATLQAWIACLVWCCQVCWWDQLWCNTAGLNRLPCVMLLCVDDISGDAVLQASSVFPLVCCWCWFAELSSSLGTFASSPQQYDILLHAFSLHVVYLIPHKLLLANSPFFVLS